MNSLRSVPEVAEVVAAAIRPDRRIVVGIAGSPGAGKSTISEELVDLLAPSAVLLPMDGFHLAQSRLVELGRRDRMGAPDTFDVDGFRATLIAIRRGFGGTGRSVLAPGFDREREEPVPEAIDITPSFPCVILEGNYLLLDSGGWERAAPMLDITFFVDLDHDVRIERLVARHERFGKGPADARAWALGPDENNALLIEATASRADYRIALG
ncbi:MAG TPA: nucleoside/nucleotide kinase family protein [Galbitalea sp.]|jgi:pantothenate kinase|nr:nucleoside/nucleotide kinase family protein [Galbitalea sp.]